MPASAIDKSAWPMIASAILFWAVIFLLQKLNWGSGGGRALVLLALLLAALALTAMLHRGRFTDDPARSRALAIFCGALLIAQIAYAGVRLVHPHLIDVATTTLAAGNALLAGENPYQVAIDPQIWHDGEALFAGFKYLPLMAAAYLPLGAPLGERGVQLTNLLLQLAIVWLIIRIGIQIGSRQAGLIAATLYLSLPLPPFQLFAKGVTDAAAVLPLLIALLCAERRGAAAGLGIGLSLSAKLLPGALFVPLCLPPEPRQRLSYAAGIALGLVPSLIYLAWSPVELWRNVVLFNLMRPADSTSWLSLMPEEASLILRGIWIATLATVGVFMWRARPSLMTRCGLAVILVLATLLSGPAMHDNYQLWWLPLFAILLGAALARIPTAMVGKPAASDLPKSRGPL